MGTTALETQTTDNDPDATTSGDRSARPLPPVMARLLSGSFWLALRTPLQAIFAFWSIPLIVGTFGQDFFGAYGFAWGFGFTQFLLEFGMSSALQRQVSDCWTRGDREGVDRAIACGTSFYAVMALAQIGVLLGVAYFALPQTDFTGRPYRLIVQLLWLQALTAPFYGISVIASSVLQAARRYDYLPRFELAIVVLRFGVLWAGVHAGASFLAIVAAQLVVQIVLSIGPAIWVMVRELNYIPRFRKVRLGDFRSLMQIRFYLFLIQLSIVLADKIDTTVLGFALANPEKAIAEYSVVSKPFTQIRQMGWTLAFLVMPAVASLVAARDDAGLDRIKYDGARLHIALILPVGFLAWIYAAPFLELWIGRDFPGQIPHLAYLLRLFLVATIPLLLSVHTQMAIGIGRVAVIGLAALGGAVVNVGLSYALTLRLGVSGVIWGTVLTTLFSNLLVPGAYAFRVLGVRVSTLVQRTLTAPAAGALALLLATWGLRAIWSAEPAIGADPLSRSIPLLVHLSIGCVAYVAGYLAVPVGRADLTTLLGKLGRRKVSG
ncbi:oligosaccharide flippase family protein [soil metagenome]